MNYLFIHQNFPAQFRHLAQSLAKDPAHRVLAIGSDTSGTIDDITVLRYTVDHQASLTTHAFARFFDTECRRGEQVLYACMQLKAQGFEPDAIVVHSGWGEALPLRAAFPNAIILLYVEMYYRRYGVDVDFDDEFPTMSTDRIVGLQARNAATLLGLVECDCAITPTSWQRSTFPAEFQNKIAVIHEGVDVTNVKPDANATFRLPDGTSLTSENPVVTFVSRDLEPLRGYHSFMRALPEILQRHKTAQILIVGRDGTSYGAAPPSGTTWRQLFLDEVANRIDLTRVHYLGRLQYEDYLNVLRISSAHVYLTYPFVLSWSLLEAMASGCAVVASSTPPVREVVDGDNGLLVDFFRPDQIAATVVDVLNNGRRFLPMRERARQTIVEQYDKRSCVDAVQSLIRRQTRSTGRLQVQ